jgi:hypothetical protein
MESLYTVSNMHDFVKNFLTNARGGCYCGPRLKITIQISHIFAFIEGFINREGGAK